MAKFNPLGIAVLVISDSRDENNDASGALLEKSIVAARHHFIGKVLVPDEKEKITKATEAFCARKEIDVVIATGGTGLTKRDVSFETFTRMYEKEIPGFAMAFYLVSEKTVGLSAVLSRPSAGLVQGKLVFSLPGSPSACRDAWEEILIHLLDRGYEPCSLAQLLPRLK